MITVERRPLTDSERQELARLLATARDRGEPFLAGGITFIVVGGTALLAWPWQQGIRSLAPVLVALVAGVLVYRRVRATNARWHATKTLEGELDAGQAEVTTYEVVDAIAVEEEGDEGSQYFLELRDGRVLFIGGQYLYELEDEKRFPNTRFEVVRTPRTGQVLAVSGLGAYLVPSSRRRSFSVADYRLRRVPSDGAVWQADFEALRQS